MKKRKKGKKKEREKVFDRLVTFQIIVGYSETGGEAVESQTAQTAQEVENDGGKVAPREHISIVLGNAGHVLHGADAELVLSPLRLAFDTKNLKVLELALDCLHVCILFVCETLTFVWWLPF